MLLSTSGLAYSRLRATLRGGACSQPGQSFDSPGMSMQEAIRPGQEAEVQLLLSAYLKMEAELKAQPAARLDQAPAPAHSEGDEKLPEAEDSEESTIGWVPRLGQVAGISETRLGALHGQLIALGLLKFQLTGRTSGIVYRVSPEGRAELQRASEPCGDSPALTAA